MKQVVILAGGEGTRLRERIADLPKPLVDVCGVPLLERQVLLAKGHGFTHALILVSHGARRIADFCAAKGNWGLSLECIDDGRPRGTAGATLAAFERLADEFLVMYGDTMLDVDLMRFHAFHSLSPQAAATLFVHPNDHPADSDLVEMDEEDCIIAFHPYPHDPGHEYGNLVNAALFWVNKAALGRWREVTEMRDFGKHLFPAMLREGVMLRGYRSPEYIKDVGTPDRLDRVCADFRAGRIARRSLAHPQAMVFLDRDGTINREVDHLRDPRQLELLPGAAQAIRRLNASDYRCCVVTNQPVVARGECSFEGLRAIHARLETLLGREGAYVDRIYYCPHHPDRGFPGERSELKIDCDCRKPKTGMIEHAMRDFNGARDRSWLVGDATVEIEAARRAGLKSVLVETGQAGLDYRAWATPDAVVPDLEAAVMFILEHYPRLLSYCSALAAAIGPGAIVLIGGQARSGKSSFAAVLRDAIRACGRGAVILSADRWLRNETAREAGVLGRFDLAGLQALLDALVDARRRPAELRLPGYHKLKRERVEAVETVPLAAGDAVLIEGVVALALHTPDSVETHRLHLEIDEDSRRQRILREYRLRGYGETEALEVYQARRSDEFPVIEALGKGAHRVEMASAAGLA